MNVDINNLLDNSIIIIIINYFAPMFYPLKVSLSLAGARQPSPQSLLAFLIIDMVHTAVVILFIIIWQALINTNWHLVREVVI